MEVQLKIELKTRSNKTIKRMRLASLNKKRLMMKVQAVTHQLMRKILKRTKMNYRLIINNLFRAITTKD